jgi:hypothetical protein
MQEGRDGDRGAGRSAGEGSLAGFAAAPERLRGRLASGSATSLDLASRRTTSLDRLRPKRKGHVSQRQREDRNDHSNRHLKAHVARPRRPR